MTLRCKVGDLCVSLCGTLSRDRVVTVLRELKDGEIVTAKCGTEVVARVESPSWLIEGFLCKSETAFGPVYWVPFARDNELRPLRDPGDDAVDELLRPLPQEVVA